MMQPDQLALEFEAELVSKHGPLVPPSALPILLGYQSVDAYCKAVSRGTVPVPIFKLENRRGRFALAKDVARWLSQRRDHPSEAAAGSESIASATDSPRDGLSPTRC